MFDQFAAGATKVVYVVNEVLTHIDFAVRVSDFIDNFHYLSFVLMPNSMYSPAFKAALSSDSGKAFPALKI